MGCCPVDEYGYANSSCILVTDCVPLVPWLLVSDTVSLDPRTLYWYVAVACVHVRGWNSVNQAGN
jgi:hypothetical protein